MDSPKSNEKQKLPGYKCTVRNCRKRNNSRYDTVGGLCKHMLEVHGDEFVLKRLGGKVVGFGKD